MTAAPEPHWASPEAIFCDTLAELLDTPPQILLDLRFAELEAARVAADQALVEIVANARDAALQAATSPPPRICVGLFGGALWVANDGRPLDRAGLWAIRRIARSSKRDRPRPGRPGEPFVPLTLGRHGVGFRSVLALSDEPRIYSHDPEGRPFGVAFGVPWLRALARAALAGDGVGCSDALPPPEARWLADALSELPLESRSLRRHGRRAGIGGEELASGLPVLPFPVAAPPAEAPEAVAEALGWAGTGAPPFVTAVVLPLRAADRERLRGAIEAQIPLAERCVMGTRIRFHLAGSGG